MLQFIEDLSDRQEAEAVRSRIDWKYVLGLELTDPGFDFSVLCEFRARLISGGAEQQLLNTLLQQFKERGWIKARGVKCQLSWLNSVNYVDRLKPREDDCCKAACLRKESARDYQLERISHGRAQENLNKVKALFFAVWKGEGTTTTELLAEFYEVPEANIRQLLKTHQTEFVSDGLQTLRGKDLKQVRDLLSLTSMTVNATTWTPRAAMRSGMLLRNSAIAKALRTSLLDAIETAIPAQAQEIERLKVELQVAVRFVDW